jgi:two-component system LytT family sensor kinase
MPTVWSRVRAFPWRWIALIYTGIGFLNFFYRSLDRVARGHPGEWLRVLAEELTGMWAGLAITPFVVWVTLRYPVSEGRWKRRWPLYLGMGVVLGFADTTINYGMRIAVFAAAGQGLYDYGIMRVRYFMELPIQLIAIGVMVTVFSYSEHRRRFHMLERQLTQAQLETLQMQLQPHFLFNSLNAISSVVYEDPRVADQMIANLSDFLRRVLRADKTLEVPLQEELELLNLYLRVMWARFEEKLECQVNTCAELNRALVPQLILQPLVENALRYAADPATGQITVSVNVRRDGDRLHMEIRDCGAGTPKATHNGAGVGLTNLAARLERLYGTAGSLSVEHHPGQGTNVSVDLPYHEAACAP